MAFVPQEGKPKLPDEILVESLELSVRAANCLRDYGRIRTLADLIQASEADLAAIPRMGSKTIKELREVVRAYLTPLSLYEDEVRWAKAHPNIIRALMNGECVVATNAVEAGL